MKNILSDFEIYSLHKYRKQFINKYNWKCTDINNSNTEFFVLFWAVFPWIIRERGDLVKQNKNYKVIARLPNFKTIKSILFDDYDCYFSSGIYSLNTLLAFAITKLRGKQCGVLVKAFHFRKHNLFARLNNLIAKTIARNRDYYIAYSKKSYSFLANDLKIEKSKIFYIPKNRIDYNKFEYNSDKINGIKNKYFKINKTNLLFIGRVIPVKGIDILLKSILPINNKVHVIIVGDDRGKYAHYCKSYAKKHELDVVFTGRIGKVKSSKEVVYFYRNADLLVLPNKYSPKEYEAVEVWGSVIDEALSLQLPVIVTNITGCADDLVKNKRVGRVVKEGSVHELRDAIIDFLNNPEKWKEMGRKGPEIMNLKNEKNYYGWKKLLSSL